MRSKGSEPPLEQLISELAGRQHGVVTRAQLAALGARTAAIGRWARRGRLHRIHRGVYSVGHTVLTRSGTLIAAVLACGEDAVLSHRSAAELWRIGPRSAHLEVTAPGRRERPGIVVHAGRVIPAVLEDIPVTTPARTLIDLADVLTRRGLERAIDEAEYLRLDLKGLRPIPGRRGAGALAALLEERRTESRTRSELEEMFLALCERHHLTRPRTNEHVEGYEVDFHWPEERLVVEVDGAQAHRTRKAFERDRLRDAELTAAGYRVMRFTQRRLEREPVAVADLLRRAGAPVAPGPRSRSRAARPRRPRP
jgi:very-short-patch-repair endonuclease